MSKIQVVLGFDMETDVGSWTPFYEGLKNGTPVILRLLEHHGITATFFFTGDSVKASPEALATVREAGHEIGAHSLFHEGLVGVDGIGRNPQVEEVLLPVHHGGDHAAARRALDAQLGDLLLRLGHLLLEGLGLLHHLAQVHGASGSSFSRASTTRARNRSMVCCTMSAARS